MDHQFFHNAPHLLALRRVVWYLYLVNQVIQTCVTFIGVYQTLIQRGVEIQLRPQNFIPLILGLAAQLAFVRLLIEVAAI